MIFFGIALLIAGGFFSWDIYNFSQDCEVGRDGIETFTQCPSNGPPWNLIGLYMLPGVILLSSVIIFKKKNK